MSKPPENPDYRPRRAHKKSRNGCLRCKQRRKKAGPLLPRQSIQLWAGSREPMPDILTLSQCDELMPSCSRCSDRDLHCQYPKGRQQNKSPVTSAPEGGVQVNDFWRDLENMVVPSSYSPLETPMLASDVASSAFESPLYPPSYFGEAEQAPSNTQTVGAALDSTELELLSHYISHTCRQVAYDDNDLFVLHVGIPNLAFRSKPLMSSLLAVAAACKCHDILAVSRPASHDLGQIRALMAVAEKHHRVSLSLIQSTIPNTRNYDQILANAALMVLYGLASHSLRIRVAHLYGDNDPCPQDLFPTQSQWISFIRAAHAAFTGLLKDKVLVDAKYEDAETTSSINYAWMGTQLGVAASPLPRGSVSGEDGPSPETKQYVLPVVSSTSAPALSKLRNTATAIMAADASGATWTRADSPDDSRTYELQACLEALDLLEATVCEAFAPHRNASPASPASDQLASELEQWPRSGLSSVSPWLRSYMARVTSVAPSKPLRRTITAFINRVPARFLLLVQTNLEFAPVQYTQPNQPRGHSDPYKMPQPTPEHLLAMNIFAHWLVLVLLLDDVWWIGGIGHWELGRVIDFIHKQGWESRLRGSSDEWWPETMYKVTCDVRNHYQATE